MPDYRAALGRGGDSEMAHMTPGEAVIPAGSMTPKLWAAYQEALDRQGMAPEQYVVGSGQESINPATGQPEFASVGSVHSSSDAHRDRMDEMRSSNPTGTDPRESGRVGSIHASPATASLQGTGQLYQGPEGAARNLGATSGPMEQGGFVDPNNLPNLTYNPTSGLYDQTTTIDFSPMTELMPGPVRALMKMADFDPSFEYSEPFGMTGTGTPAFGPMRTSLGRESVSQQGMTRQRTLAEQSFMRPEQLPAPQVLGLSSAMSPLQQRSAIASRAVAGQGGEYTSPEAQAYYDNLLQQLLIGEDGTLAGLDTLLPIDLQYLAQVRGIDNPADTSALLTALSG